MLKRIFDCDKENCFTNMFWLFENLDDMLLPSSTSSIWKQVIKTVRDRGKPGWAFQREMVGLHMFGKVNM